jgi:hypothetical protein
MGITISYSGTSFVLYPKLGLIDGIRRNIIRDQTQSGILRMVKLGEDKAYRKYSFLIEDDDKENLETMEAALEGIQTFALTDHNGDSFTMEMLNEMEFVPVSDKYWTCELELLEAL